MKQTLHLMSDGQPSFVPSSRHAPQISEVQISVFISQCET